MTIYNGDCLEIMRTMESNSIDCIVTDPPYGLSFMGKKWDKDVPSTEYWKEALRICKPGSMLAAFGGDRTHHHLMVALEQAGWEIRTCIYWLTGQGFPKSHNFGRQLSDEWNGYGTALKPAAEIIILAMKPLDGTFKQNAEKWGVAGINIDASRIGTTREVPTSLSKCKTDVVYGNYGSGSIEELNPNKGRWPANLILDEEATEQLDQMTGNLLPAGNARESNITSGKSIFNIGDKGKRNPKILGDNGGGASRFFKCVDRECYLCYNPCTKAQDKECKHTNAPNVNVNFKITQEITLNIAQENVQMTQEEQFVQNVKSAENLCDSCAMNIVQGLVKTKNSDFKKEELQATLDYITDYKRSILIQNLVSFAELWENTDITPTTQSLSLLFGSVRHAIENYTNQEDHNPNGKKGQSRFLYCPKASSSERNRGLEDKSNIHPTIKPIALMQYIIKLLVPPKNALILDPFAGSGSTILAAKQLGLDAIGIEISPEYAEIARLRIEAVKLDEQYELSIGNCSN